MKKISILLVAGILIGFSSCAYTRQVVNTPKGTYRFYNTGNETTRVEYCTNVNTKATCKDVSVTYE